MDALKRRITSLLQDSDELRGVPRPVIKAVVSETLDQLDDLIDDEIPVGMLQELEFCDSCGSPGLHLSFGDDELTMCKPCLDEERPS